MTTRSRLRTGALVAGFAFASLASPLVGRAAADDHHHRARHWYHDDDDDADHARWWHDHHESTLDGHTHGDNTKDCRAIRDRIRYDNSKIRDIQPGRHEKAAQWYRDDIQNANNDMQSCRR